MASDPLKTPHGYDIRWREGKKQKSKSFNAKKLGGWTEAKRLANAFRISVERSRLLGTEILNRSDVPTLRSYATDWLASRSDLQPTTERLYAQLLETHVLPELGHLSLLDLRPRRLTEWQRDRLAAKAGPSNLGMAQGVLNQILKRAVRDEYLERNPLAGFTRPRSQKREHHWATPEEVEKLRGWFLTPRPTRTGGTPPMFPTHDHSDPLAGLLISILSYVGIRPQDALALRWDDLKGDRLRVERKVSDGRIIAGSKTGDRYRRSVLVPGPVAQEFIETRFVLGRPEGLIFPRRKDGQPWTKDDWNRWRSRRFYKARDDAGLPKAFSPYSLRHSAASIQIAAGWSPHEVARQLGHSVVMSLRVYQHSFDEQEGKTPIALDEQIREARKVA